MPSLLWTRNPRTWAQLPRKPCKFRRSSSGSWETPCAGKNLVEENGRRAQCPFRRIGVAHTQEKFHGTSTLHCRRNKRTTGQTPRTVKICTILTPGCTLPLFLPPSGPQLIMEWTPRRAGSLYNRQWESRKAGETLSPSKENLRGNKPGAREEVDRQMESNLGHWGGWKGERRARKQCGNKIVESQPLNTLWETMERKTQLLPPHILLLTTHQRGLLSDPSPSWRWREPHEPWAWRQGHCQESPSPPPLRQSWLLYRRKGRIPYAEAERRLWKRKTLVFWWQFTKKKEH